MDNNIMKIENDIKNFVNQNSKLLKLALKANQESKDWVLSKLASD